MCVLLDVVPKVASRPFWYFRSCQLSLILIRRFLVFSRETVRVRLEPDQIMVLAEEKYLDMKILVQNISALEHSGEPLIQGLWKEE